MCDTCGCSSDEQNFTIKKPHDTDSEDLMQISGSEKETHSHSHSHGHSHRTLETISVVADVLSGNNLLAERNRGYFEAKNVKVFNLVSSPGSGKTSMLEALIGLMKENYEIFVIEGDQQTLNDANRIKSAGASAIQINTGNGCHLDANMVNKAVKELKISESSLLFIENVGNLVCPALFDLGEGARIVVTSVTEGADKPLKYPNMFETSHLCVINKTDLLPYVDFDVEIFKENALKINHHLDFIQISATKGENMEQLFRWITAL